jgi:hypothetical protein
MPHTHSATPPDLDSLLQKITQAHSSPDDESITEAAIVASVQYLEGLPPEIHWLCATSPIIPVIVQAIQLWGYGEPPAQAALARFQPLLAAALSRCPDCAVEWHMGFRKQLKRVFTEVYSYDEGSTAEFYNALEEWDAQRVIAALDKAMKAVERIPTAWKNVEVKGPLVESLAAPNLLLREQLLGLWKELFLRLDKTPAGVGEEWLAGALVLVFDSNPLVRDFGEQMFKKRRERIRIPEFDFNLRRALGTILERQSQKVFLSKIYLTRGQWPGF